MRRAGSPASGGQHEGVVRTAAVLLASTGRVLATEAVREAVTLATGAEIRVLSIAKVYGTSFGLQNPGLFPSKREWAEQRDLVAATLAEIKRIGGRGTGEVVAARNPVKVIARVAESCGACWVIVAEPRRSRLRRLVEGDTAAGLRRRLGPAVEIRTMTATHPRNSRSV